MAYNDKIKCDCCGSADGTITEGATYPVKLLTYKSEPFYPITSTKYVLDSNGDSIDTIIKNVIQLFAESNLPIDCTFNGNTYVFKYKRETMGVQFNEWVNSISLNKGITFVDPDPSSDFYNNEITIYPYQHIKIDGVEQWRYCYMGGDIVLTSNLGDGIEYTLPNTYVRWIKGND